jgi:uncharacterized protein (DUF1697 family)
VTRDARVAFIRGINVGGKNKLPMAELRVAMAAAGYSDVRTYIQSGNVVYRPADPAVPAADDADAITQLIGDRFGFRPAVVTLELDDVARHLAASPFAEADPAQAFLVFVSGDLAALGDLDASATNGERWKVIDGVLHLHCPNGIGRSKLGERLAASRRGVTTTTRNLRTIAAVIALADPA